MDVEAVFGAAAEMYDFCRAGKGPGFLIAHCYRFYGHGRKDPSPYRDRAEEAEWKKKDPVAVQRERLLRAGLLDEIGAKAIEGQVVAEMDAAVKWASEAHEPEPADLWTGVYAE
jgi:TPP-dependent pyruvate/acetoin dehydrogenase alpha subunit